MTFGKRSVFEHILNAVRKIEKADRVRHPAATPSDSRRQCLLCELVVPDQGGKRPGRLKDGKVLALEVFYQRDLAQIPVVPFDDANGDLHAPRHRGGAPSPFAGDDTVFLLLARDEHRLNDAVFADAFRQRCESFFIHVASGLFRVGQQQFDGEGRRIGRGSLVRLFVRCGKNGAESAP